ncbi:3'-5' exoribonuclease YhaM family protein [Oleidesulfovibrio sp.]|uniref:3'-5' exoribonuclease YhaM family protein n=1 Tax=Oleidesulfovibrio sp. TaxID=2909707 RepID=UPI003A87058F
MEKRQFIKDIAVNGDVNGLFLIASANQMQAKNGPFWRLEICDSTGTLNAKVWSPLSTSFETLSAGEVVHLEGRAGLFRDKIDINVDRMRILAPYEMDALDMGQFLVSSERDPEEMHAELLALCKDVFTHKPWRKFVTSVLRNEELAEALKAAPAAKSVHHAYRGGLLEHILSVSGLCMRMADHYPEIDRQMLLAGAVFHDLGKAWELSGGLVNDYTDEGRLLGHIHIGLERLEPFIVRSGLERELAIHFKHLILSHHGEYEFGSPRRPKTREAMMLHYADNLDAKMAQMNSLFKGFEEGETGWTPFQPTLQRFLYNPVRTPEAEPAQRKRRETPKEEQCSLLLKA